MSELIEFGNKPKEVEPAGQIQSVQSELPLERPTQPVLSEQPTPQEWKGEGKKEEADSEKGALVAQIKALADKVEMLAKEKEAQEAAKEAERRAQEEAKAQEEGKLPESLEERKAALEKEKESLRQERIQTAIESAAREAGIKHLDFLAQVNRSLVTIGEDNVIRGHEEAVQELKERHPSLFKDAPVTSKTFSAPLAGGPAASAGQPAAELNDKQKRFAQNFGWTAHNMRFQGDKRGPTVTFHDAYVGAFAPREGGRR